MASRAAAPPSTEEEKRKRTKAGAGSKREAEARVSGGSALVSKRRRSSDSEGNTAGTTKPKRNSEVLYPCHVFENEVKDRIKSLMNHGGEEPDATLLQEWSSSVQEKLRQQDDLMVTNILLVRELRGLHEQCSAMRKKKLKLTRQIQQVKEETALYGQKMQDMKESKSQQARADDFLQSLRRYGKREE